MTIISFFSNAGVPVTSLSPTIDIWTDDGTQVVSSGVMTEVDGGFYKYDFSTYDGSLNYVFRSDGGVSLADSDRYTFGSNEIASVWDEDVNDHTITNSTGATLANIEFLADRVRNIEEGNWRIIGNQMIFYDLTDTELFRFNFFDEFDNPANTEVFRRIKV